MIKINKILFIILLLITIGCKKIPPDKTNEMAVNFLKIRKIDVAVTDCTEIYSSKGTCKAELNVVNGGLVPITFKCDSNGVCSATID